MFIKVQKDSIKSLSLITTRLRGSACQILFKAQLTINHNNMVYGSPAVIAKQWGMTVGEFTSGIRELKLVDLVRKYTKKEYMLNPDYVYSGDVQRYYVLKHMWDTQTTRGIRKNG